MREGTGRTGNTHRFSLRVAALIPALAPTLILLGCSTPLYLAKLGWGEAKIVLRSRPNDRVLGDPAVEESTKEKIRLVMEAKAYGEKSIGLDRTSNFSTFYQVEGPSLLYVVTASRKDRLEAYSWWFPITGRVTEKGFFGYRDALKEKERLRARGLDVYVQGAQAYSTLGWFKDPIFSTMLDQDPAMVVNVVLHEMTHATVFFKGELDFNEQLATFVGGQGSVDFTGIKFGAGSPVQRRAEGFIQDSILFARFIDALRGRLEEIYSLPIPLEAKLERREAVFLQAKKEFKEIEGRLRTDLYTGFESVPLNNASVLALGRYVAHVEGIQRVYEELGRSLKKTVSFFKELKRKGVAHPRTYMAHWLEEKRSEKSASPVGD
ncbi:MAG: aminopeptidase [Deltaproteobacteria bacterium]|nr:aminopeptidase [Deltaproteobacteria bacterium]MBW2121129.1 aminopeptidase [Deltaproteobacteria bacterium]